MRRFLFAFLLVAFSSASLSAQRRPRTYQVGAPDTWFSAALGGFTGDGVNDGQSASSWNFGRSTNFQYGASLERAIGGGSSFGIAGTYARIPFVYTSTGIGLASGVSGVQCGQCDAHLDMTSLVGTFHVGSGVGFHQVIAFSGGIVAYRNLKRDSDNAKLAPAGGNIDPLFSIGYGIGYGLSERTAIEFVPDYAIAIHERSGLSNGASNTNSMRSLRLALRMGFGGQTVRR